MSGWLSRLFDTSAVPQDYTAPANQLGPLARQVMANPVGTETTSPYASQSVGVPSGPFNPIEAMTPNGPMLGTDVDRAHALVTQGITEYAPTLLGMVGDAPGGKPGFTAYHGSPHDFSAFDTSKIGTGEGAQAYGHGLYFAENEGIATGYRDRLAGRPTTSGVHVDGVPAEDAGLSPGAIAMAKGHLDGFMTLDQFRASNEANLQRAQETLQRFPNNTVGILNRDMANRSLDALDELKGRKLSFQEPTQPGHMYEVNVNADPAHFLDWDKPLSEQHPVVQKAWSNVVAADKADIIARRQALHDQLGPDSPFGPHNPVDAYNGPRDFQQLTTQDPVRAAQMLRDAGIPGIRYLDAGSRGAGSGTYNHVVFDANTLSILRKYGIAGLITGGTAAASSGSPDSNGP